MTLPIRIANNIDFDKSWTYNLCALYSRSVLTSIIKESCSQSRPTLLNDLLSHLNKLDSNQIKFIWILSHIGVTGNDRADALAKEALGIDYVNSADYLEFEELFTLIKTYIVSKWQLEYSNNNIGHF